MHPLNRIFFLAATLGLLLPSVGGAAYQTLYKGKRRVEVSRWDHRTSGFWGRTGIETGVRFSAPGVEVQLAAARTVRKSG